MAAVITDSSKICCTCGKDVTHEKRMKDSTTGRYWCYDCGSRQPGAKNQAILCPKCKKPMSAHSMYRVGDQYICHDCHEGKAGKKGTKSAAPEQGSGKGLIVAIIVVLGLALMAYLNGWIG